MNKPTKEQKLVLTLAGMVLLQTLHIFKFWKTRFLKSNKNLQNSELKIKWNRILILKALTLFCCKISVLFYNTVYIFSKKGLLNTSLPVQLVHCKLCIARKDLQIDIRLDTNGIYIILVEKGRAGTTTQGVLLGRHYINPKKSRFLLNKSMYNLKENIYVGGKEDFHQ